MLQMRCYGRFISKSHVARLYLQKKKRNLVFWSNPFGIPLKQQIDYPCAGSLFLFIANIYLSKHKPYRRL